MSGGYYHSILRVSAAVVAIVLLFDSGAVTPLSKSLSDNTMQYLANSVGMFAQVEPNAVNELTAELTRREQELAAREREIENRSFGADTRSDYSIYILSTILFILTVLIVLNYALDLVRHRRSMYAKDIP